MVEKLVGVLPRLVFFENRVKDFLFGLLGLLAANVLWRNDLGIDVPRIIVKHHDLVYAEDGTGARDAADLNCLVVGFLGVVEPAAWEGDADGPVSTCGGLEYCGWAGSVNVGFWIASRLFGWAGGVGFSAILVDDDGGGFALLDERLATV